MTLHPSSARRLSQPVLALLLLCAAVALVGCGRRPGQLEMPDNATIYTYPPAESAVTP